MLLNAVPVCATLCYAENAEEFVEMMPGAHAEH